jgi:hypothetical protein
MKKTLLLIAIFFGTISGVFAQYFHTNPVPKFGLGLSSGFAVGPASGAYPEAGGLSLNFELPIRNSPVSILLSTGYTFYVSQGGFSADLFNSDYGFSSYYYGSVASFIPVEAGLKIHVIHRFFIEGSAGASFNINSYSGDYTGQKTAFIYSTGAGYSFPSDYNDNSKIDLSLVYENRVEPGGGYSQVALRAIWDFNL